MRFEHLIEVNNLEDPRADVLSREQLWNGLLLRAKAPSLFIPHMDGFAIVEESDNAPDAHAGFWKIQGQ